jgi:hypothetical protein
MEKQTLTQAGPAWASFGLVLLIMCFAVAVAAIKDARLAKAAANTKSQ